jgi:hypothetical protein
LRGECEGGVDGLAKVPNRRLLLDGPDQKNRFGLQQGGDSCFRLDSA